MWGWYTIDIGTASEPELCRAMDVGYGFDYVNYKSINSAELHGTTLQFTKQWYVNYADYYPLQLAKHHIATVTNLSVLHSSSQIYPSNALDTGLSTVP